MEIAIGLGYLAALGAPLLHRITRRWTGWLLALLPAALFFYFLRVAAALPAQGGLRSSMAWVPDLGISLSFYVDGLAVLLALLITGIGALILIYAGEYLASDPHLGRFYSFLFLFMASMVGVVLADNLFTLFIFWELTSISSYLLIGFENEKEKARAAALQALLVTGGGGLALLFGLVLLAQMGGSPEISVLATRSAIIQAHPLYLLALLLILLGAFTKSAQVPFHFWLPGAMEAPTPVSAYLHSATMVKAGVYLLARLSPALAGSEAWVWIVTGVGLLTAIVGALLTLHQTQLKRILAYSTISSLGLMVMLIGLATPEAVAAALVFLLAHALYKGALFLAAGAVYHETGTQDITELGGLRRSMPILAVVTLLAALSLAGFGPLLSFIGKELIFETTLHSPTYSLVLTAGAVVAAVASIAAALLVAVRPFFGAPRPTPQHPHDGPPGLWIGAALLALLGLGLGLLPQTTARLLSPAVTAVLGTPYPLKLSLWHGLNPALALSGLSILLGVLFYTQRRAWRRLALPLERSLDWGPARLYRLGLEGLNVFARRLTDLVQNGHLNDYLRTIILFTVLSVGLTYLLKGGLLQMEPWPDLRFYEAGLAALILISTLYAVRSQSRLASVAAMGIVGYGVALIFILFGAPDLAMTQLLIETITVILLVLVLYHLPSFAQLSSAKTRRRDAILALSAGALMTVLVMTVGSLQYFPPISNFFIEQSLTAHGRNIVNVILVDFRAMDTMGEITVLALAAIGVYALLKLRLEKGSDS